MRHERTWAPLRKKPDLASKIEQAIFLLVLTFLAWHWAACATAPLVARYAEPEGCGSDLDCCQRFDDCNKPLY